MPETTNQLSPVNPAQARFEQEHRRRRLNHGDDFFRSGLGNFDHLPKLQREMISDGIANFSDEDKKTIQARVANEFFMSASMNLSPDDISENYGTYKTGIGGVLGLKEGATDVDLFNALKSQVDASDKRKEFLHAIATEGYAAGVGKGGKWSDQYNPLYQKLKELDGFDAKQADDYLDTFKGAFDRGADVIAGDHETFRKTYEHLEAKMGIESPEGGRWAATDKEIDVLLDSWTIEDVERFTEYAALRAAEKGDEKGFLKQSAEALLRGVKMRGREHFRVFERSALNDAIVHAKKGRKQVTPSLPQFAVGVVPIGGLSRTAARFEQVSEDEAAKIIDDAQRGLHRLDMAEKFVEVAERVVDPIKAGNWFTEKMWYPFMENISFTAQAMIPGGLGIAGTLSSTYDIRYREMRERHPGLDHEQLSVRAGISAFVETPFEMLQAKLVFGKLPATGRFLERIKGPGAKRLTARVTGGGGLGWSENFVQERFQDELPLFVGWLADAFSESHPEVDWRKEFDQYADGAWDTFWQVLPLAAVGRGAATFKDFADFREMAQKQKLLKGFGLSDPWIDKILKATTVEEGNALIKSAVKDRVERQVKKAFSNLDQETMDEAGKFMDRQDDPKRHTVVENPKGGIDVIAPDGATVVEGVSVEKGESIIAEAEGAAAELISEDVYEAIERIKMFQREGASIVGVEETMNIEEKILKKLTTPKQAMEAIQEYAQQEGISTEGLTPAQMKILGENELDTSGKIAKAVSRIYKGANPLTPFEETAEGYIKLGVENGELSWADVAGWKNEIEQATGKKTHGDNVRGLTEWFSSTAQGYLLGERHSEEAARFMPPSLIKFLNTMRDMFRAVVKIAADLMRLKKRGELNKQLEKHLKRSVGLDVGMWDAAADRDMQAAQQEMEAEGMETTPDVLEVAAEITIPTTHKDLQGELDRLKEELGGLWASKIGRRKAPGWDAVVQDFRDRGFDVGGPDDVIQLLLQAAEQRQQGKAMGTYSLAAKTEKDAAYMKAVEADDMETAQRMVDAAAKAAARQMPKSYGGAPDSLMGFRKKGRPSKGYEEGNYKTKITVVVGEGSDSFVDGIRGLNVPHAMERARRNWEGENVLFAGETPADPITYDADGNVIPLSQRFDSSKPEITYSIQPRDADYKRAVESGDMDAAQEMVDAAAKAAGYDLETFHGTAEAFNKAITPLFLGDEDVARAYAKDRGDAWKGEGEGEGVVLSVFANFKKTASEEQVKEVAGTLGIAVENDMAYSVLDPNIRGKELSQRLIDELQRQGFDSARIDDFSIDDPFTIVKSLVAFDPNQIKSADPVTKDDQGNVIPLSERFDPSKPEITYAMRINKKIAAIEAKFRERKISERISKGDHKGVEFSDAVKEKTKNLLYKVFPMQEMADEAVSIIDKGMDEAARTFYNDASGLKPAVRSALGTALTRIYNDNGQHDKAADVAIRLAELGTEFGQGVKVFDLLGFAFDSAESVQAFFQRHANTVKKDIKTDPVIGAVRDVAIDIQEEARKLLYQWVNEYLETHGKKPKKVGQKRPPTPIISFSLKAELLPLVDYAAEIIENFGADALAEDLVATYGDKIKPHLKDLILEGLGRVMGNSKVAEEGRTEVKKRVKKRAWEKLKARNIEVPKQAGSALDKILELMDKGEITSAEIDKVFQEKFKIPSMDGDMAKKLADHAKRIGSAPIGSAERRDRVVQMMDFVYDQFEGVKGVDLAWSIWYGNILSGYHTHMRNLGDTALQVLADSGFAALFQKHPVEAVSFLFSGFNRGTGVMLGASEAWAHLISGQQMLGRETVSKFGARSALERFVFAGGKYNPFNWVKFVGRALISEDGFFFHTAREVKARLVALEMARSEAEKGTPMGEIFDAAETLLNNQSDQIADFEARAKKEWDELDKEGMTVSSEKWQKRRVKELRIQEREGALVERASEFAARATYNYKPEGVIGVFGEMIGRGVKEGTPLGVGRFLIPFVRVPANVTNRALDYTPVGFVRSVFPAVFVGKGKGSYTNALAGEYKRGGSYEMKSADQRAMELKKGIVGTAAVVALLLRGGGEDEDEGFGIHAAGPMDFNKSKQLRSTKWIPFSIQIGKRYYSYKNTPLSLMFAFVGGVHDAQRYGLYKGDEQSALVQAAYTFADGASMVLDQSYLSSLSDFFEAMGRQGESRGRALERLIKRTADPTSLIPYSNMAKQITRDLDGYVRDKDDMLGALYSMTPVTTHWNKPKLDALGMPIGQRPVSWLWSVEDEGGENHRIWKMIAKKQAFLGSLYGYRHRMDSDQYYEFQKHRGEMARKMIAGRLSSLERMSSEDAKKVMRQIGSKSTAYAKRIVKFRETD